MCHLYEVGADMLINDCNIFKIVIKIINTCGEGGLKLHLYKYVHVINYLKLIFIVCTNFSKFSDGSLKHYIKVVAQP